MKLYYHVRLDLIGLVVATYNRVELLKYDDNIQGTRVLTEEWVYIGDL